MKVTTDFDLYSKEAGKCTLRYKQQGKAFGSFNMFNWSDVN